jgi:hypothetical protein
MFKKPLWKCNDYYVFPCVCVRACACVSECVLVVVAVRALTCASTRVVLLIQHASRRHIVICGLSGSTTFFHVTKTRLSETRYWIWSVYVFRMLMRLEFSGHIFEKVSNIKFQQNPSCGSRVFPCGQTDILYSDTTKLIVAFRNFLNAPKKGKIVVVYAMTLYSGSRGIALFFL